MLASAIFVVVVLWVVWYFAKTRPALKRAAAVAVPPSGAAPTTPAASSPFVPTEQTPQPAASTGEQASAQDAVCQMPLHRRMSRRRSMRKEAGTMPRPSEIRIRRRLARPSSDTAIGAVLLTLLAWLSLVAPGLAADGAAVADEKDKAAREIFVPFADLHVLLENQPSGCCFAASEYDELVKKAKKVARDPCPAPAVHRRGRLYGRGRAAAGRAPGTLAVDVLEDGLHALPLDSRAWACNGPSSTDAAPRSAAADDGRLTLFVEGIGRHELMLDMVAPLETTAARQVLQFRLPRPAAATLR